MWEAANDQTIGKSTLKRISAALGDLQVEVLSLNAQTKEEEWVTIGRYDEIGPLAQEKVLLFIPQTLPSGALKLRLTNAQGNFRIDQVALTLAGSELIPRRLKPSQVRTQTHQNQPALLNLLKDQKEYLVTYPGDLFYLDYQDMQGSKNTRYFLESTGHYIEWQQPAWLKEQNEDAFMDFLLDPKKGLQDLAPKYKKIEPKIEKLFWESRFRIMESETK